MQGLDPVHVLQSITRLRFSITKVAIASIPCPLENDSFVTRYCM